MKGTLVIPIYNEFNSVYLELKSLLLSDAIENLEVIIVDDGSNDGTTDQLNKLQSTLGEKFILITHQYNRGYGAALKTGIIEASTDNIIITDADNSYPNNRIPELFKIYCEEQFDMVVGARTGKKASISLIRRPPKWILNKLANYLSKTQNT